jgi:hypothetical protein
MRKTLALAGIAVAVGTALASCPDLIAQFARPAPSGQARIVTGEDIGFRVEGVDPRSGAPTGTWMLRVNGDWVAIGSTSMIKPAQ